MRPPSGASSSKWPATSDAPWSATGGTVSWPRDQDGAVHLAHRGCRGARPTGRGSGLGLGRETDTHAELTMVHVPVVTPSAGRVSMSPCPTPSRHRRWSRDPSAPSGEPDPVTPVAAGLPDPVPAGAQAGHVPPDLLHRLAGTLGTTRFSLRRFAISRPTMLAKTRQRSADQLRRPTLS